MYNTTTQGKVNNGVSDLNRRFLFILPEPDMGHCQGFPRLLWFCRTRITFSRKVGLTFSRDALSRNRNICDETAGPFSREFELDVLKLAQVHTCGEDEDRCGVTGDGARVFTCQMKLGGVSVFIGKFQIHFFVFVQACCRRPASAEGHDICLFGRRAVARGTYAFTDDWSPFL